MTVHKKVEVVLERNHNVESGMWRVKLNPPQGPTPTHQLSNTLMAERTKPELTQWYHNTLFRPVNQTLIQAIKKGYFATWTYLTIDLINAPAPINGNSQGPHAPNTKEPQVHQDTRSKETGGRTYEPSGTTHQHSVHQYHQPQVANSHRPNSKIPSHIK